MKHIHLTIALLIIASLSAYAAGGGGGSQVPYLSTTTNTVTSFNVPGNTCLQSKVTFDFEPVNGDETFDLDMVWGRSYYTTNIFHEGMQRYNNGSGDFPNDDGTFFSSYSFCVYIERINDVVFGKLRPLNIRRDLAILRQYDILIYQNTANGIATSPNQVISAGATSGAWGPFVAGDNYEDLVVSDGSQLRAYPNLTTGSLGASISPIPLTATKIIVAQMDESIYKRNFDTRFDLVSYSGSQLSIRLNNNNNGFSSTQTFDVGFGITGMAVGDINDDGLNDVVVGGYSIVKAFYNIDGTINTSDTWSVTNLNFSVVPLIGDMGTPTDPNRNDGWNDIVVTGYSTPVMIFANHQGSFNSTPEQSFQSGAPFSGSSKAMLVDIQNTGGLSLVYHQVISPIESPSTHSIRTNKHTGDPAPAPPKGVQVVGTPPDQYGYSYPKISWTANSERDLHAQQAYQLWRRTFGSICGTSSWYQIATLNANTWEYTDLSIGTVMPGGDCIAEYKLAAKDASNNLSDYSATVPINFASWIWKSNGGDAGTLSKPSAYQLYNAYPNPFNPSTQIKFDLPEDGYVSLNVFDVLGRKVAELVNGNYAAGYHTSTWNANGIATGVYFARFTATDVDGNMKFSKISKLILNK